MKAYKFIKSYCMFKKGYKFNTYIDKQGLAHFQDYVFDENKIKRLVFRLVLNIDVLLKNEIIKEI